MPLNNPVTEAAKVGGNLMVRHSKILKHGNRHLRNSQGRARTTCPDAFAIVGKQHTILLHGTRQQRARLSSIIRHVDSDPHILSNVEPTVARSRVRGR
jgi:hypothetical protein